MSIDNQKIYKNINYLIYLILSGVILLQFFYIRNLTNTRNKVIQKQTKTIQEDNISPTPLQGPGVYACDPVGICNKYSNDVRIKDCKVTFADKNCLGKCKDIKNRCSN